MHLKTGCLFKFLEHTLNCPLGDFSFCLFLKPYINVCSVCCSWPFCELRLLQKVKACSLVVEIFLCRHGTVSVTAREMTVLIAITQQDYATLSNIKLFTIAIEYRFQGPKKLPSSQQEPFNPIDAKGRLYSLWILPGLGAIT